MKESVSGDRPLRKLFTKEQRAFYEEHAPEGLALDDLSVLGPIFVLKVKFAPPELGRKVVAEMWLYPDDSRLLELSTKCAPSEAFQVSAETRAFLTERGIDMQRRAGDEDAEGARVLRRAPGTGPEPPTQRPTGWIVLTGALLAAVDRAGDLGRGAAARPGRRQRGERVQDRGAGARERRA